MLIFLCANVDGQIVTTQKGAADYVAKYISKYGTGQSVNARIGSLIDDIITKIPESRKATIASVMAKAFIATAVPDTLCSLDAWHILFGLNRVVCSRGFTSLQSDQERALRSIGLPCAAKQEDDEQPKTLARKFHVERYLDRYGEKYLGPGLSVEWLEACSLARFVAEVDEHGGNLLRRTTPKIVKVTPYINLDMGGAHAPRMARMALRNHRPFQSADDDPLYIREDAEAVRQLEEFVRSSACPRWMQARFALHNRVTVRKRQRDKVAPSRPEESDELDAAEPIAADAEDGLPFTLLSKTCVARRHCMRWHDEGTCAHQPVSAQDVIKKSCGAKVPTAYLKALLEALRPGAAVPTGKVTRMETLAHYVLQLDLEAFLPNKRGFVKPSLPTASLRLAAETFTAYHPMKKKEELQQLRSNLPYTVLWQEFKRAVLKECGFSVLLAPSRRIYFEEPFERPHLAPAQHPGVKEGKWREAVLIPQPYAPDAEDMDTEADRRRDRAYIATAANEHAMGRGGTVEEEMRLQADDDALDCPDTVTKAEWDACWPYEDLVRPHSIKNSDHPEVELFIPDGDERLSWGMPERQGGCSDAAFAKIAQGRAPNQAADEITDMKDLDPTQQAFVQEGLQW